VSLDYAVRPLTPAARLRMTGTGSEISQFKASWSSTLTLLDRELSQLNARDVIMMIDCTEADLRLDGRMRSNARPMSSKVGLSFNARKRGSLLFCCGRFRNWQDNVRGLALGLEALRKLDRYGIIQSTEQYEGFRQLATGSAATSSEAERAWTVIANAAGMSTVSAQGDPPTAFRNARKATHPDSGGSASAFRAVEEAAKILGLK